jgi:hypothetical protein
MEALAFEPRYLSSLIVDTLALSDLWQALAITDPLDDWAADCTDPAAGLVEGVDWLRESAGVRITALAALQIAAQARWDAPAWSAVCAEIRARLASRITADLCSFDADAVLATRTLSRAQRSYCNQAAFSATEQQRGIEARRTRLLWLVSEGHLQVGQTEEAAR